MVGRKQRYGNLNDASTLDRAGTEPAIPEQLDARRKPAGNPGDCDVQTSDLR